MMDSSSPHSVPVTVLMSVYNRQDYLREAVESILQQTFSDFEFLIVDDASTDRTPEILESYRDPRIRVIRRDAGPGLIAALNLGLEEANGKYIARMDSDDISLPHRLEKQVAFMEEHPDTGVVAAWIVTFGDYDNGTLWRGPTTHEEIRTKMFCTCPIWNPVSMIRKNILDRYGLRYRAGYDTGGEDYKLWVEMSEVTRFASIPEVLLKYRRHGTQITKEHTPPIQSIREELAEKFLGRPLTEQERIWHERLHFARPLTGLQQLQEVKQWISCLKAQNRVRQTYEEPLFSDLLDATLSVTRKRNFYTHLKQKKRYTPAVILHLFLNKLQFYRSLSWKEKLKIIAKSLLFWPNKDIAPKKPGGKP